MLSEKSIKATLSRRCASESGSATVEFTLVLGVLVLFTIGLVLQASFWFAGNRAAHEAAAAAVNAAQVDGTPASAGEAEAVSYLTQFPATTNPTATVTIAGGEVTATVTADMTAKLLPFGVLDTVAATAVGPVEVFTPASSR